MTLPLVAALVVAGVSLLLPQDTPGDVVRVVGVAACVPWFLRRLGAARGGATAA